MKTKNNHYGRKFSILKILFAMYKKNTKTVVGSIVIKTKSREIT